MVSEIGEVSIGPAARNLSIDVYVAAFETPPLIVAAVVIEVTSPVVEAVSSQNEVGATPGSDEGVVRGDVDHQRGDMVGDAFGGAVPIARPRGPREQLAQFKVPLVSLRAGYFDPGIVDEEVEQVVEASCISVGVVPGNEIADGFSRFDSCLIHAL